MPHCRPVILRSIRSILITLLAIIIGIPLAAAENPPQPTLPIPAPELDTQPAAPDTLMEEPDTLVDEDDADAPQTADSNEPVPESLEAALPPPTEPSTEVPPAEELLQLAPLSKSTARFADLFTPPAEATEEVVGQAEPGHQGIVYNVPIVLDPSVQGHIHYFNTSIRSRFEQWLVRLSRYRPLVHSIFSEFDLPSDLIYLSLVESGFNPYAYSRARATGPWQFMKGTAKLYGLRVDSYVDERRDPIKSTVAAARYLRDLYDLFGTWPLAMAAYNAGEGKVMRALQKAQADSFSDIAKTRLIRRETREYVPRFMAATIIARNPDRYGFPTEEVAPHQFEEVAVSRPIHLKSIANVTGIPYQELRLLNPELRRDATPPDGAGYLLKVPVGTKATVVKLMDRIPTYKFPSLQVKNTRVRATQVVGKKPASDSAKRYQVRVGDSLEKIAKRFGISVKALKANNNLSGALIKAGDLLVIPH
ncbi:MAG TPA: transglycosylase SLT domain-containing protein [Nitrospiraceae bacterium]|nr:transglycosylase SLT domain-containing protein [Nitrospiraceae bacterium]